MIVYDRVPISHEDSSKLKAWLGSAEAQLFKECVASQMNAYYFDAINTKSKHSETDLDATKLYNQSLHHEHNGTTTKMFLEMFDKLSTSDSGFFKLNIKT